MGLGWERSVTLTWKTTEFPSLVTQALTTSRGPAASPEASRTSGLAAEPASAEGSTRRRASTMKRLARNMDSLQTTLSGRPRASGRVPINVSPDGRWGTETHNNSLEKQYRDWGGTLLASPRDRLSCSGRGSRRPPRWGS